MKKINYLMLGAAGLLLASCSQDDLVSGVGNGDGTSTITMNLSMPEINTRSYGDGTTATKLMYAVYEVKSDNSLSQIQGSEYAVTEKDKAEEIKISKAKTFVLLNDKKYKFVFWAEAAGETPYTVTWTNSDVNLEANYRDVKANDENLDAFYGSVELTVNGNVQMDVPLYRPFAQINIGTNDLQKAEALGYKVTQSMIKAQSHSSMNLLNGTCDTNTLATMTFKMNNIPSGETFPVEKYEYLAMTYVLVPVDQENISVSFDYMEDAEEEGKHIHNVSNVPVMRNHRTNIYGQVLTGNAELTVRIEPIFDTPDLEPSPFDMVAGLGGTVVLEDDVELSKIINFTKDAVIDLNGQKVTSPSTNTDKDDGSFTVRGGANVTIKGDGEMETAGTYASILIWADEMSTITIENGTFTSHSTGSNDEVIYIGPGGGTIYIKGGTFKSDDATSNRCLLNCYDDAYEAGIAKFVVTGGTFYGFDPAHANSEPGGEVNWVAPGYKSVETGEENGKKIYTVVPDKTVEIASTEEMKSILENVKNDDIILITTSETVSIPVDLPESTNFTIMGSGKDKTSITFQVANSKANESSITFKDLTMTPAKNGANHTNIGIYGVKELNLENVVVKGEFHVMKGNENATFDNCEFYYYDPSSSPNLLWIEDGNVIVKNSMFYHELAPYAVLVTYNRWQLGDKAVSRIGDLTFENCTFKAENIYTSSRGAVEVHSELLYAAGTITINNCTVDPNFKSGYWREIFNYNGNSQIANGEKTNFFKVVVDGVVEQTGTQTREQEFE